MKKKDNLTAYMFLAPCLVGFILFLAFPILFSFVLAFSDWDLVSGIRNIHFIGLENFKELFQSDIFYKSLRNNIVYTVTVVPLTIAFSLLIAIILNDKVYLVKPLRLAFFTPFITSIVAISVVWLALYHPTQGPINQFLMALGVENPPKWLSSPKTALGSISVVMIWVGIGYGMMVYMAALKDIPKDLYEAGDIEGAGTWNKFRFITWPMITPTTFFLLITRIITSFEVFGPINVMTGGGPAKSTSVLVFEIYEQSFRFYRLGYGSAIAWVLFIIIFLVTILQWIGQKKWVNE